MKREKWSRENSLNTFSDAEAKTVESAGDQARLRTFFQLWCLKEAALKSIGEGLPFGLDAFEFELSPIYVSFKRRMTLAGRSNLLLI